ncbi:hypothetical protein [Agromyces cerinus]|uniref:J domain-containing protein n=1 Tax=Agromyces cerinus subsp. cerinus TaxID=232089 RepID=A0A1N6HPW5_9MICO|nr:hypothetical protein [Agromyces cerinus]SIO21705.1 hypothetical protein SAMN05443544_3379 [Agromyces cerinus subsp. cerinus]
MESIAARAALNLEPARALAPERIEAAYRAEAWARHPSRYPDAESRHAAESWATTLQQARATLLAESAAFGAANTAPPAPRRGLSTGWIVGIVAGGSVIVIGLIVALAFGVTALGQRVAEIAEPQFDSGTSSETVERFSVAETGFTFPAAIEYYDDWRYADQCSAEYEQGCWMAAVIPESDCSIMIVSVAFAETLEQEDADYIQTLRYFDVVAGEPTPVVYGDDDYASSWLADITCNEGTA